MHHPTLHCMLLPLPPGGADASVIEANKKQLGEILDSAEAQLAKTPYLAGEDYSVADAIFTPLLFRISMVKQTDIYLTPRPKVSDYYSSIKQRPSFKEVFGPSMSQLTAASLLLPALARASFAGFTGWY